MNDTQQATLAELAIVACSEVFRDNGEVLVTGIGTIPRIAAGLAKLTHTPEIMMTDSESWLVEDPVPLGMSDHSQLAPSGYMPFSRVFNVLEAGRRHAMITPVQIDRWGQSNISVIGDYDRPKVQMLGSRGLPGNSINHPNSMFVPGHSKRVFVAGEVDMVGSAGYNPDRWARGVRSDFAEIRSIVTNLCVMDFGGPGHAIRAVSLHPGVTFEQVQNATGFPLDKAGDISETALPTALQLDVIDRLDPHNQRAKVIRDNPLATGREVA